MIQIKDLHELWKGYMQELLELDKLKQDGWKPGRVIPDIRLQDNLTFVRQF